MIVIKAIVELKMPLRKRGRTAYKETAQITGSLQRQNKYVSPPGRGFPRWITPAEA